MALPNRPPNTIFLGGGDGPGGESAITVVNDLVTTGTPIPGMAAETYNDGGVQKWRAHSTAGGGGQRAVYLEELYWAKDVNDPYKVNSLARVGIGRQGTTFWMIVPSGQNIVNSDLLESNGDGRLRKLTSGVPLYKAQESTGGLVTKDTRIRVEVYVAS